MFVLERDVCIREMSVLERYLDWRDVSVLVREMSVLEIC